MALTFITNICNFQKSNAGNFSRFFIMKRTYLVSIISFVVLILYSFIGSKLINNIGNDYQKVMINTYSVSMMLFIFLFFSAVETIIFSFSIIYYLKTTPYFNNKNFVILIIPSFLFGLSHFSSLTFIIITFFAGIILNYNFLYYLSKTNSYLKATISTFLVHLIYNLTQYYIDLNT